MSVVSVSSVSSSPSRFFSPSLLPQTVARGFSQRQLNTGESTSSPQHGYGGLSDPRNGSLPTDHSVPLRTFARSLLVSFRAETESSDRDQTRAWHVAPSQRRLRGSSPGGSHQRHLFLQGRRSGEYGRRPFWRRRRRRRRYSVCCCALRHRKRAQTGVRAVRRLTKSAPLKCV